MSSYRFMYLNYADSDIGISLGILDRAWRMMEAQGLLSTVFYDGLVRTFEDMAALLLRPGCVPVAVYCGEELAALAWLNGFEGRSARGHFVLFRKFWGRKRSVPLGHAIFDYLLHLRDERGYLWDVLLGITPESNGMAWRRSVECGAEYIGIVPCFCLMADESVQNGVAVAVTRESIAAHVAQAVAETREVS